jgi:hypothetical protein
VIDSRPERPTTSKLVQNVRALVRSDRCLVVRMLTEALNIGI